ncbi:MAG: universal stress protein [Acidobacteriota bacterium]
MTAVVRNILVGSSLRPASDRVVASALALARAAGARLHVAHAFPPLVPYVGEPFPVQWISPDLEAENERALAAQLRQQAQRVGATEHELGTVTLACGVAHDVLAETTAAVGADVLVVGGREIEGGRHFLLGSTTDRVLRRARCPVLVLHGEPHFPPRTVVLPVDLSPLSAAAFGWATRFLAQLDRDHTLSGEALFVLLPFTAQLALQFDAQQVESLARTELQRIIDQSGELAARIQPVLRTGEPRTEILAHLERDRPDLAVIATHSRAGLDRLLIGSVAAEVARAAPSSVLVVPPPADA